MLSNLIFVYRDSPTFFPKKPFNSNSSVSFQRSEFVNDLSPKKHPDLNLKEVATNRMASKGNAILCQICLQLFKRFSQRNEHMIKMHPEIAYKGVFQCGDCNKHFHLKKFLKTHLTRSHKQKSNQSEQDLSPKVQTIIQKINPDKMIQEKHPDKVMENVSCG